MKIPILFEPVNGDGYRSRGGEPFALSAHRATREEVLAKLREQLERQVREGSEVVSPNVRGEPHPLAEFAGMFKDDPRSRAGRSRSRPTAARRTRTRAAS